MRVFQSTRPVRGATRIVDDLRGRIHVSIHAPRAGRDFSAAIMSCSYFQFQSTRPVRGATRFAFGDSPQCGVSIHAPRAGRDSEAGKSTYAHACFNPRAPCGARPSMRAISRHVWSFQSTRPVRGATAAGGLFPDIDHVSIHAPRAGRDADAPRGCPRKTCFNPRAPCGARL